ncbi:cholinesterase-like [Lytechinus variegatus]|uniref:cholinesterase-like n=1 Tax=Lytechinus variegatus TaxID=7654 RepID=UPI001BB1C5D6|nr:cholinesterase-like [Lytechinus variegatus]
MFIYKIQGVPYAEPPERFSAPVPKSPWPGTLNTTEFKSACMQPTNPRFPDIDEDCLYLNVYSPKHKLERSAVLVFIHGGSFLTGSAMTYMFYGVPLAAVGDVIVVTINYRVGIFSRFSTGTEGSRGNYGMLDQVEALRWIQRNIGAFGGDQSRVTIFGASAGSASVHFHLLSKLSRGLFSQAIMQSGNAYAEWAFENTPLQDDRKRALELGQSMGCQTASVPAMIECLRSKDATDLMEAAGTIHGWRYKLHVDGLFLEDTPDNLYRMGDFKQCPIMAGYNKDEGTARLRTMFRDHRYEPYPPSMNLTTAHDHVTSFVSWKGYNESMILRNAVLEMYTDWSEDLINGNFSRTYVDVLTDVNYACTSDKVLRAHQALGVHPIFKYIFTHAPTKSIQEFIHETQIDVTPSTRWLKATHSEEVTFVFGLPFIEEISHVFNVTEEERSLSLQIMLFWANFAKSGDPNKASKDGFVNDAFEPWLPFTENGLMHKDLSPAFPNGRAARARECHFLNVYMPRLKASTASISEVEQQWKRDFKAWQYLFIAWKRTKNRNT